MPEPSPQVKGLKKVLSNRRPSDLPGDETIRDLRTNSLDSVALEKSPTRYSARSISQDGSSKSGSSGMRKLLPGHSKRKRRKLRQEELKAATEEFARGRMGTSLSVNNPPAALSTRTSSIAGDGETSLLTDDSEVETPPLASTDSRSGYLTMSSPLASATTLRSDDQSISSPPQELSFDKIPTLVEPSQDGGPPSPKSHPAPDSSPTSSVGGLVDRADTLNPQSRSDSMSKLRGASPGRRFRDVFGKPNKSPKVSPQRRSTDMITGFTSPLSVQTLVAESEAAGEPKMLEDPPKPLIHDRPQNNSMPNLEPLRPLTPPAAVINTPLTTVTPPTPTDTRFEGTTGSPQSENLASKLKEENSNIVVSPSGNMISHRRIRSTSSITHQPSKLSSSITAPLTPTSEESRTASGGTSGNRTASGGLFSSWVSVAQNAATTITNLTGQNRNRSGTNASDPLTKPKTIEEPIKEEEEASEPEIPRKPLAIETLGSGDLNFEDLGLNGDDKIGSAGRSDLTELRKDATLERDEAAAKVEDLLAKRAVSAAYEKQSNAPTPIAEIGDPLSNVRHSQTFSGPTGGEKTPPNGSLFEGEVTSVKRTNSVRSKIVKRRSRGSSTATGQSAIGAIIGPSVAALANPAKGPRLTGFTMAPKQRNRNFHQQFRSVPEDDYLIEDYSCALQKEILLAGRIYISEGHICFFSNILGWVTTVVISFEEVVSIERENTAVVFPNAIAIQTLHARHTFRSLIYREQTYDLLIGIWRVSHPTSFQKSMNGKQLAAEEATDTTGAGAENGASAQPSDGSTSEDAESAGDDDSAPSLVESSASHAGSDLADGKITVPRKPSGMNASAVAQTASILAGTTHDVPPTLAAQAGLTEVANDFPGPATHAPTECTDSAAHYDKIMKDEVIPAPLGKIYSLLYGPESGFFVRKFLADECKCTELVFEDDKKGLNRDIKSRQYTYIKPLGGSIGPKQTKCITTENLDFFDLERAVTVTCTTQTPDVPSGNAFSTKTRYCLSWAPGNATRFQMNCTIEWTTKSWLKGPIEKGANEGQQQYGDSLVKVLKGAVSGRPRGTTNASKVSKAMKKKRKGEKKSKDEKNDDEIKKQKETWGLWEPLRTPVKAFIDVLRPALKMEVLVAILSIMVVLLWFRGPTRGSQLGPYAGLSHSERLAAYDSLWAREENEFWDWLEARASVDTVLLREQSASNLRRNKASKGDPSGTAKHRMKQRQRNQILVSDAEARIREEKISQREMEDAIQITRERLRALEVVIEKEKQAKMNVDANPK
ncbi:uncharacterized protein Z518_01265 [Rhinocladiella mackenziei CBS 650.93]|uniref:Rhinocladiella mackenziei CBS 650.93 unplaced genomic scaffold supercont1.1, whole genome shotgun sequence n=1 Tax=Rhinocladiella mackenziei CBS 650.93 TaxID=1442369 RepID=A0A0D2IVW3_9EURO|nr:uncharacterized protein Z518_01265 [Rhinocladiella mackenziei CBS 650.93]KIX10184.1 hypothetical protein Z518_01265 [Rhinocladiella mackenziei CBS 650.93]